MNICFIIDDWNTMKPETETTIRLIREAYAREHNVGILYPESLTIRNNLTYGFIRLIDKMDKIPESMTAFHKKANFTEQHLPLNGFDAVFLRKNPPVDTIMLNFLDSIKEETFILNDIDGIRKANNKLYTSTFYDPENTYIPVTYVSKNKTYLRRIIDESPSEKMILKPLNGYGGSGVIVLEKDAKQNINSLLDFYIDGTRGKNYVIIQNYVEGADKGDVRVLMLNGKSIGAYRRVPAKDDVRANIHAGGSPEKHTLTKNEEAICEKIGQHLVQDGLYFAGVDLINEKLIEVNVLSPGGIVNINKLNKVRLEKKVVNFIEQMVASREEVRTRKEIAIKRKQAFRAEITGAKDAQD